MAENGIYAEVKKLANRIANDVIKNHPMLVSMAHWHTAFTAENKSLREAIRIVEMRIIQVEKEIESLKTSQWSLPANTAESPEQAPATPAVPVESAMSVRELKKIRKKYNFNQKNLAELLGVSHHRYCLWERGQQPVPQEIADNLHSFVEMPLEDLRLFMHTRGIFQPNATVAQQQKKEMPQTIIRAVQQSRYTADDLKRIRTSLHFTQKKMAETIGVPESTYANWECNQSRMPDKHTQRIIDLQEKYPPVPEGSPSITASKRLSPTPEDIKALRIKLGLTQRKMIEKYGVSKSAYQKWEAGSSSMSGKYQEIYHQLLNGTEKNPETPDIDVVPPNAPPAPECSGNRIKITPEMLEIIKSVKQELGVSEEKLELLLAMNKQTFSLLENGTQKFIRKDQWERLKLLLALPQNRRDVFINNKVKSGEKTDV